MHELQMSTAIVIKKIRMNGVCRGRARFSIGGATRACKKPILG
jgi:hypothetical protein